MFLENKYTKWYWSIINKAKSRINIEETYTEIHHIIPKSLGGSNSKTNLVKLTAKEHYIAHLLLIKMVSGTNNIIKMFWAWHRMSFSGDNKRLTGKLYSEKRKKWSIFITEVFHPKRNSDNEYLSKLSKSIEKSWANDFERKRKNSDIFKELHRKQKEENLELYMKSQKEKAIKGALKARDICCTKIKYNDKEYIGWKCFESETGISKHLYKKYYKNGINPSFRIGKDGPLCIEEIQYIVDQYCKLYSCNLPKTYDEAFCLCENIKNIKLLTKQNIKLYLQNFK